MKKKQESKNPIILIASIIALFCAVGSVLLITNRIHQKKEIEGKVEMIDQSYDPNAKPGEETGDCIVTRSESQSTGNYKNNKVLEYKYNNGKSRLSFGLKDGPTGNYIYLSPLCSEKGTHVGYYMEAENGCIEHSTQYGADLNYSANIGTSNFLIKNRTYDTLVPAEYVDETNYGVRWSNLVFGTMGENADDVISIRAVDLDSGSLIAVLKLTIAFRNDHYELSELSSADVASTKELSPAMRTEAIETTVKFLKNLPVIGAEEPNKNYWSTAKKLAQVEATRPYFENLYNPDHTPIHRGLFYKYDIYAVNIPVIGFGFVTVYLAPYVDVNSLPKSYSDEDDLDLTVIGYDAFHPETTSTVDIADDSFYVRVNQKQN